MILSPFLKIMEWSTQQLSVAAKVTLWFAIHSTSRFWTHVSRFTTKAIFFINIIFFTKQNISVGVFLWLAYDVANAVLKII